MIQYEYSSSSIKNRQGRRHDTPKKCLPGVEKAMGILCLSPRCRGCLSRKDTRVVTVIYKCCGVLHSELYAEALLFSYEMAEGVLSIL